MSRKFTILGETGAGKTCYLATMYGEFLMGTDEGYIIHASDNDTERQLRTYFDNISRGAERGRARFPYATPAADVRNMQFDLTWGIGTVLTTFKWIDYPGTFLNPAINDVNTPEYENLEKNINESSTLFICVDGQYLADGTKNEKIRRVKQNCCININPFLSKLVNQGRSLPPIVIIVTKYDLCQDVPDNLIREVIYQAFRPLFLTPQIFIAVIKCSLGLNISDNNYTGELQPLNVHLPILMGIKFALADDIADEEYRIQHNLMNAPPHTRDFSRELGGAILTNFLKVLK